MSGQGKGKGKGKSGATIGIRPVAGDDFELVHPECIVYREMDYEEGIEIWREGEPEEARDALRYALEGCTDNLWIHVALGRIALEGNDATLARGHFGYAVELVEKALPMGFRGRLPGRLPNNRPFYEAADGLAASYEALEQSKDAAEVRDFAARLQDGGGGGGRSIPPPKRRS